MSTRATIHFHYRSKDAPAEAIIYRHGDGYPDGLGKDLEAFFEEVKCQTRDTRFDDPSYLAAKWVVYDAAQMVTIGGTYRKSGGNLDFLSVGIMAHDPGDIEYRYHVICKDGNVPEVVVEEV